MELIGAGLPTAIAVSLVKSVISYVREGQNRRQPDLYEELQRLEKALPQVQALLEAVDAGEINVEAQLQKWVWQFRDAVDETEDFMDEVEYYRLEKGIKMRKSMVSYFHYLLKTTIHSTMFPDSPLGRLRKVMTGLDNAISSMHAFVNLMDTLRRNQSSITSNRDTSSLLPIEHKVVGRDDEKKKVIDKLLNSSSAPGNMKFSILPIVGVGGIGKTTLARSVYNDEELHNHFDKKVWVCVSNNFDVLSLTKKIYELVSVVNQPTDNLQLLQQELLESLRSKKLLLVLDDVWNDNDVGSWGTLLAPFSSVERGSVIILTTRMEKVADILTGVVEPMFLRGLDEQDYWEFFKICAFGDQNPEDRETLCNIGEGIVRKLKCSPLAAKTVGGILRTNLGVHHWTNVLESKIWELDQQENDIMPALKLSYLYLPSHLKPCFRFCSVFPEDHEFDKQELVEMWVALGLVQKPANGNRRPKDIGNEYFNDLVRKSFFDCKIGGTSGTYYVMHDLLHELAEFVSRDEYFRIESSRATTVIPRSVRHLSINTTATIPMQEITKLKNLRTLLLLQTPDSSEDDIHKLLRGLKSLRILKSSHLNISKNCIRSLRHLRYLRSYSETSQIPDLSRLHHLKYCHYQKE